VAAKHGMTREQVKQITQQTGSRSRKEIEAAITRHKDDA
jgi:hypothetical protein